MAMFGAKKKEEPIVIEEDITNPTPTDVVLQMRGQGLSNNEIVAALQKDGYNSSQIFDAMNQADVKTGVGAGEAEEMEEVEQPMEPGQEEQPEYEEGPAQQQPYPQQFPSYQQQPMPLDERERIEELTEAIIEEKWNELVKNINKIIDWKNATEARINRMEQAFKDLKQNFEEVHRALITKIGSYDEHISNVGSEIKAMEKVFQKVLPTLTENVNELSRVTDEMKKRK